MKHPYMSTLVVAMAVATLSVFCLAPAVQAQSDSELRRENQQLKTQVEDLRRELEAAQQQIERLQQRLDRINAGNGGSASGGEVGEPFEEKVSIDESKPDASPRAFLSKLQEEYHAEFEKLPLGDTVESRERLNYLKSVDRWRKQVAREHRMDVEWYVTIEGEESVDRRNVTVWVQAVDPKHGTELGDEFLARIPKMRTKAIEENGMDATYVIKGRLMPDVLLNPDRASAGTFDSPPLIGPFAEYNFGVDVQTVNLAKVEQEGDDGVSPPVAPTDDQDDDS